MKVFVHKMTKVVKFKQSQVLQGTTKEISNYKKSMKGTVDTQWGKHHKKQSKLEIMKQTKLWNDFKQLVS